MVQRSFSSLRAAPLFAAALLVGAGLWPAPAEAQKDQRIAAVVNDDVVSFYDLNERLKMIISSSNLRDSPELRRRLRSQMLSDLIAEKLQMQEAKRLNIKVEKEEIDKQLARLEKLNRIPTRGLEAFLAQRGIKLSTLEDQLRAQIAWSKVIRRRMRRETGGQDESVGEDEVDEQLARIKDNRNKPSHLVSMIILAVEVPDEEAKVLRNAKHLLEQIRSGADFSAIARQFSQDAAARNGGDIGWVQPGQLEKELDEALLGMRPGQVSEPIRTSTGYQILWLRKRRRAMTPQPEDVVVKLRQVFLPVAAGATPDEVASQKALAQTISETVTDCKDMAKLDKELGSNLSGNLGSLKIRELPAELRPLVLALGLERASKPIATKGGLRVLMVCERKDPPSSLPSRAEIRGKLKLQRQARRAQRLARRILRGLRHTAHIDKRL